MVTMRAWSNCSLHQAPDQSGSHSYASLAKLINGLETSNALAIVHGPDASNHRRPDVAESNEAKNVSLQSAQTMRAEVPTIEPSRHSHSHDDSRALPAL